MKWQKRRADDDWRVIQWFLMILGYGRELIHLVGDGNKGEMFKKG